MKRFLNKIWHGVVGIAYVNNTQSSMKIQIICAVLISFANVILPVTEATVIGSIFFIVLVYTLEMINTAIEKLCDYIQPNQDPKIKLIKDISAGAVLLACVCALVYGLIIYIPAFIKLIS